LIRIEGRRRQQTAADITRNSQRFRTINTDGDLADKPGRTRRYHVPGSSARTIAALLCLRDQVIAPILAGTRSPRQARKPGHWTAVDRDYDTVRIGMQTLFGHLASLAPHRQHFVDTFLSRR
jgi:hypothetical protein